MGSYRRIWFRSIPVAILPLIALFAITRQSSIPWRYFFMDLPVVLQVPVLAAVFTSVSVVVWCGSGLIALFASNFCSDELRRPLRLIGVLSLALGIDDLFMIHETLLPRAFGMTEKMQGIFVESLVFSVYGIFLLLWILKYHKRVDWGARPFLVGSIVCFIFSLSADMASSFKVFGRWSRFRTDYDFQLLVEDGPKLIGVVLWSIFVWHFSKSSVKKERSSSATVPTHHI